MAGKFEFRKGGRFSLDLKSGNGLLIPTSRTCRTR